MRPPTSLLTPALLQLALLLLAQGARCQAPDAADRPPNVIFILADDMGYGDIHALQPGSSIPTPHLDRLAGQGMVFTDAHSPSAVCTPTRYGVLTGRYCWRSPLKKGVINGYGARVIERGRRTVGDLLRDHGYRTGIVGKWHLGLDWPQQEGGRRNDIDFGRPIGDTPTRLGFDASYIIPASLDFPPYVYIDGDKVTDPATVVQPAQPFPAFLRRGPRAKDFVMTEALDHLASKAISYIQAFSKDRRPFFLYFPLTAPHKPTLPHPRFRGKTKLGDYGDFVVQVDDTVGKVLAAVDAAGIAEDTLVIYTSDNGSYMYRYDDDRKDHVETPKVQGYRAEHHRANGPLRGTKADIWEAGHRVPFLARWPKRVAAGSRCDRTICLTDLMATCAALVGAQLPADMGEDSFSFLPLLLGEKDAAVRPPVVHHSVAGMFAIREGRWKLIAGNGSGGRERPSGKPFGEPFRLYDIEADLGETKDVLAENPEVARRLTATLERFRSSGRSVDR